MSGVCAEDADATLGLEPSDGGGTFKRLIDLGVPASDWETDITSRIVDASDGTGESGSDSVARIDRERCEIESDGARDSVLVREDGASETELLEDDDPGDDGGGSEWASDSISWWEMTPGVEGGGRE